MKKRFGRVVPLCAAILGVALAPAPAQTIDKLTDYKVDASGVPAITSDGSTIWTGGSLSQLGGNPLHKHQLFKFDRATGSATQVTDFDLGVNPIALELTLVPQIDVSDDGAWIAFVSPSDPLGTNRDASREVFVMDETGGQLLQLSNDPAPNAGTVSRLAISGDGSKVVFVSNSDLVPGSNPQNFATLFIVDRAGTNLTQLVTPPGGSFAGLDISNDGTRVVFSYNGDFGDLDGDGTSDNDDFSYEAFQINADGTGLSQITDSEGGGWDSINTIISGDGEKIVYQSNNDPSGIPGNNNTNQQELFVIDWDGADHMQLTESKSNIVGAQPGAFVPSISDIDPDGSGHIVTYASDYAQSGFNDDGNGEIFQIRSDGSLFDQVTDSSFTDGSFFPMVSGDGETIAFLTLEDLDGTDDGVGNDDLGPELFAVDRNHDGTYNVNPTQLTAGYVGVVASPRLTSDGLAVYFLSDADLDGSDVDRGGEIYRIDADGTGLTQITDLFTGGASELAISGDGTKIAFIADSDPDGSNADGGPEVFVINSDGTGLGRITSASSRAEPQNVHVSRAGDFVYFDHKGDLDGNNSDLSREVFRSNTTAPFTIQAVTDGGAGTYSHQARLSDDGSRIVFTSTSDYDGDGSENPEYVWINETATLTALAKVCGDPAYVCREPDLSTDGSLVAFSSSGNLAGNNADGNFELFLYDLGTMAYTQLSNTLRGSTGQPRFTNDGAWLYFTTNSEMFETDPDRPYHSARLHLATGTIERIGALNNGTAGPPEPDDTGAVSVFEAAGNITYENWDLNPEIYIVRHNEPAGGIEEIGISGASATLISVPLRYSGPMRFDFLRGELSNLQIAGGVVDLGPTVCLEDDSLDLDNAGFEDTALPAPGSGFFYLWRGDEGLNRDSSWGTSSDNLGALEREQQPGTGCTPS